ncbi:hypothetical protein SUGI_1065090 [Cryptomeria japonica]|nr:hypothetical protein SUGI_1065090 [Cryptomeria japonica]
MSAFAQEELGIWLAATIGAIVVSVNYRLAPEFRLPAAYDDSMEVLHWLRSSRSHSDSMEIGSRVSPSAYDDSTEVLDWLRSWHSHSDPWLNAYADFGSLFLVGESSGGNIVHHLLMRTASATHDKGSSEDSDSDSWDDEDELSRTQTHWTEWQKQFA